MSCLCAHVCYCETYTLCRITSVHNSDVVKSIIDAVGNDYDSAAIRGKIICSVHAQRGLEFLVCVSVSVHLSICLPVCLYVYIMSINCYFYFYSYIAYRGM